MRIRGAKNYGGGELLSAYAANDGTEIYVRSSGAIICRTESGATAAGYGDACCMTPDGRVTVKGGIPVYDD